METLEQLVEALQAQGRVDPEGGFQVDLARARGVLAERQLERQDLWLLPLVQVAHLWEAARVELSFERDTAVVEILACQRPPNLAPWLRAVGDPKHISHPSLGPLVLACEVALAAGFRGIELSCPNQVTGKTASLWLKPNSIEGEPSQFEQATQLKLRLLSPALPWWSLQQKRQWSERIQKASDQIQQRAGFSLAQPMLAGVDLRPNIESPQAEPAGDVVERVWLSRQPLNQLMAYPGPSLRSFSHDWVGRRLARWKAGPTRGLLRQWVHAEKAPLASDLHMDRAEHWLKHLTTSQAITLPRELRLREGYLAARGVLQWNPKSSQPGKLIPLRWGLSLGSLELPTCPGVTAWLSAGAWSTDLSHQTVVRNTLAEKSVEFVQAQFTDLLNEVLEAAELVPESLGHLMDAVYKTRPAEISFSIRPVKRR